MNDEYTHLINDNLNRIANAIEEILRLVKADQEKTAERYRKYDNEEDMLDDLSKPWKETK